MNLTIHCPENSSAVPALASSQPLVLAPFLDQTVLAHALSAFADQGVKRIRIEASDRIDAIRQAVGQGEAWGLQIEVTAPGLPPEEAAILLDRLPQLSSHPLWRSYKDWYAAQIALIAPVAARRVGMREVSSGVFAGLRSRISPEALLVGPCWIGANVCVEAQAVIGPGTIIADTCFIDRGAEVRHSVIGSKTYVGAFTEVAESFADQGRLLNLDTGSLTQITDAFLLGAVQPQPGSRRDLRRLLSWFRRPDSSHPAPPTDWISFGRSIRFGL